MVAEIAQQLGEHVGSSICGRDRDNTTLGETMVTTNRGENPKGGGYKGQVKEKMWF